MLRFQLSNKREHQQFEHAEGPLELGRGPKRNSVPRCVIQDLYVSKDHVRIEERPRGTIRVENLSQRNPIWFADNTSLQPNGVRECPLPVRLTVGETLVDVEPASAEPAGGGKEMLETISQPLRARGLLEGGRSIL